MDEYHEKRIKILFIRISKIKLHNIYPLELLDYCLYRYIHNVSDFFKCFMSKLEAYTQLRTETLI